MSGQVGTGMAIGIAIVLAMGMAIVIDTGTGNLEAGVTDRNPRNRHG